jgi:hypothetical protein
VVKKVAVTVYDAVPEDKAYLLRVPCLKPVEKPVIIQKVTVDAITIPGIETRLRAITLPCEQHLQVPVPPPASCSPVGPPG